MGRAVTDLGLDPSELRIAALALSAVIGVLAAYVTLELARRVRTVPTRVGLRWLGGAALSLGTGIWSLHVIGVSAQSLPYAVGYHPAATLVVWLGASLLGLIGLGAVSGRLMTLPRVVLGATVLGSGIATAQLGALLSLGVRPGIDWAPDRLAATYLAAIAGAVFAYTFSFRMRARSRRCASGCQAVAAGVFGVALVVAQQFAVDAAGLATQTYSQYEDRITPATLVLLASVGSVRDPRSSRRCSPSSRRACALSLRRAEGELQRRIVPRRPDRACRTG